MAIIYPLNLPTHTGLKSVNLRAVTQTAMSMSPFTYKQQIHNHSGQRWEIEVTLPPMQRADAEQWLAWLLSLNGMEGTFLMGDPLGATARGSLGGTPVVNGANQTGQSLTIDGCTPSVTGWLKAGDYIQLGSDSTSTLHKVLVDVNTDTGGAADIDIFPAMRTAPEDGSTVTVSNCVGRFRLNSGQQDWSIDTASIYGITFGGLEAIT
jgi:hypothetical protein